MRADPVESSFDEFQHECIVLARKMMFPVVSKWSGTEYVFTQFDWCPCPRCCERNQHLRPPEALSCPTPSP